MIFSNKYIKIVGNNYKYLLELIFKIGEITYDKKEP